MTDWIIFYGDGKTFSSDDGLPESAPRENVQVIAVSDIMCGRRLLFWQDYYCWYKGEWIPHDSEGLRQYLDTPGKDKIRLCGYWLKREDFIVLMNQALLDPRLPERTAKHPSEPDVPPSYIGD